LPETPIYSKSNILYHLTAPKMPCGGRILRCCGRLPDAIAVARANQQRGGELRNALAESQIKLLGRFTKRVIVNYDPDMAGQAQRNVR
jgi:DNA primase